MMNERLFNGGISSKQFKAAGGNFKQRACSGTARRERPLEAPGGDGPPSGHISSHAVDDGGGRARTKRWTASPAGETGLKLAGAPCSSLTCESN